MTSVSEYADAITALIDADITAGWMPATVSTFSELHDFCDANSYALEVVPQGDLSWDAYMELLNEVEAEVDRRLRGRS